MILRGQAAQVTKPQTMGWPKWTHYFYLLNLENATELSKVLWLSRFYSNYQFVSFGGCFWIFGGSNNLDSMFLFHPVSYFCYFCQKKKIRGTALGTAAGAFFAFIFQMQHSYLRYSKREVRYVNKLFRIACYTHTHE